MVRGKKGRRDVVEQENDRSILKNSPMFEVRTGGLV